MNQRTQTALPLLLALLLWGPPAPAENSFVMDPEPVRPRDLADGPVPGIEATVPLPPWPRDADLIAFVPDGPRTPLHFAIDGKNLSLHSRDSEVHYTLVITAASGTRNLSFEGLRCTLRGAYKTFAYGSDGRFMPAPEAEWQPITATGSDAYREDLRQRFCVSRETHARPLKDMLRALRGHVSTIESTGFQAQ